MSFKHRVASVAAGLGIALMAGPALAQWELDNANSSLDFVSIKNEGVAESHHFETLFGFIGTDGTVNIGVDLDSVKTLIDIRDERMRELLFETADFPSANIHGKVEPEVVEALQSLEPGGVLTTDVEMVLSLHGQEAPVSATVIVINEPDGGLRVLTVRPVLLKATDFDLVEGISALKKVAGLDSIDTVIPVTFHLLFEPASES